MSRILSPLSVPNNTTRFSTIVIWLDIEDADRWTGKWYSEHRGEPGNAPYGTITIAKDVFTLGKTFARLVIATVFVLPLHVGGESPERSTISSFRRRFGSAESRLLDDNRVRDVYKVSMHALLAIRYKVVIPQGITSLKQTKKQNENRKTRM